MSVVWDLIAIYTLCGVSALAATAAVAVLGHLANRRAATRRTR